MIKLKIDKAKAEAECEGSSATLLAEFVLTHVKLAEFASTIMNVSVEQAALFIYQQAALALSQAKEEDK